MGTTGLLQRMASLYARRDQTVHLEVVEESGALRLIVSGPATARRTVDFADEASLRAFQREFERDLAEAGFRLIASAERRAGGDRRSPPRGGTGRRR